MGTLETLPGHCLTDCSWGVQGMAAGGEAGLQQPPHVRRQLHKDGNGCNRQVDAEGTGGDGDQRHPHGLQGQGRAFQWVGALLRVPGLLRVGGVLELPEACTHAAPSNGLSTARPPWGGSGSKMSFEEGTTTGTHCQSVSADRALPRGYLSGGTGQDPSPQ